MSRYKKSSAIIFDILVLFVISLIPFLWIGKGEYVTGNDAAYPINILETYKNRFSAWISTDSFGQDVSMHFGSLFIHSILAAGRSIGLSISDAQKITFSFWFFAMGSAMYIFAKSIKRVIDYRYFPLLAAILYSVNFYLFELWKLGAATTFSVYTVLPLMCATLFGVFLSETSVWTLSLWAALALFFFNGGAGFGIPLFGALFVVVATIIAYYLILCDPQSIRKMLWRLSSFLLVTIGISLCINAYWILPFVHYVLTSYAVNVSAAGGVDGVIGWTKSVSEFTSISNLFRLQGFPDWYGVAGSLFAPEFLSNPILIAISMVWAPIAYSALLFTKTLAQKKFILVIVLTSLLAVFFSAGTHEPTGWMFILLMKYLPGFVIFRSAQYKFMPAIFFSFALLISYVVHVIISRVEQTRLGKTPSVFGGKIILGIIFIVLLYHYPYFYTDNFTWNKPLTTLITVPSYILAYDRWSHDYLSSEDRILVLPMLNRTWGSEAYTWNYFSVNSLFNLLTPRPFVENSQLLNENQKIFVARLYEDILKDGPMARPLLNMLSVSTLVLRKDAYSNLHWIPSEDARVYDAVLSKSTHISRVWEEGLWSVYKTNVPVNQKIYSTTRAVEIIGDKKGILAGILFGEKNFYFSERLNQNAVVVSKAFSTNAIYSMACETCSLDLTVAQPSVSFQNVLPGSFFYPVKLWKEKRIEKESKTLESSMITKLGLSLTRISELLRLSDDKIHEPEMLLTMTTLKAYWDFIGVEFHKTQLNNFNVDIVRSLEAYGTKEKTELLSIYEQIGDKSMRLMSEDIIRTIDGILLRVREIRLQTFHTKTYVLPKYNGYLNIYLDLLQLPKNLDGSVVLPVSVRIGDTFYPIDNAIQGNMLHIGSFMAQKAEKIFIEFSKQKNLFQDAYIQPRILKGLGRYCLTGTIASYDWKRTYRITLLASTAISADAGLFVQQRRSNDIDETRDGSILNVGSSYEFGRDRGSEQYFYFSGADGDANAAIYYCAENYSDVENVRDRIDVEEVYAPILYARSDMVDLPTPSQNTVTYKRVSQTKYEVKMNRSSSGDILIFNENYNPKWKLYKKYKSANTVTNAFMHYFFSKPVFEKNHFIVNGYANAWFVPQDSENEYIIEYYPQRVFIMGVGITVASFGLFAIGLIYMFVSRRI